MKETANLKNIWLSVPTNVRLWRINTGKAWVGSGAPVRLKDGTVILKNGRPISFGLVTADNKPVSGVGDLIGFTQTKITPDMVGKTIAVFTSIECKREQGGRVSAAQNKWMKFLHGMGAIADVVFDTSNMGEIWRTKNK